MPRLQVPPNCDLTLGMVCVDKEEPGRTVWTMAADERFTNPAGLVQGGFLAAFCDSAMGAATVTWARGRKVFSANAELKVSFLAPVRPGGTLTCTSMVISGGGRVAFAEAEVVDGEGRLVAKASSTYILTPREGESGTGDDGAPTGTGNGDGRA
ncbi:MAG: PaaI family thioesterase [Acidimicrobiales bacterium]